MQTSITVPASSAGGTVSISESATITQSNASFTLLGQQANLTAPSGTLTDPLVIRFQLAAALVRANVPDPNNYTAADVTVLRNGIPVAGCTATSPISPDPCVAAAEKLASGVLAYTIRTTNASAWNFGVQAPTSQAATPSTVASTATPAAITTSTPARTNTATPQVASQQLTATRVAPVSVQPVTGEPAAETDAQANVTLLGIVALALLGSGLALRRAAARRR